MNFSTSLYIGRIVVKPTQGVKEGCPYSPLLFAIVYELLIKRLVAKYPDTFVYVDDIAIIVKDYYELERLLTLGGPRWGSNSILTRWKCATSTDHGPRALP